MAGTTDKAKGLSKEAAGKATGNKRMESEGKVDRAKGKAKDVARLQRPARAYVTA
jgi:uncharacterized protein YjbJ (UPF0337 family)